MPRLLPHLTLTPDSVNDTEKALQTVALVAAGPTTTDPESLEYLNGGVDEQGRSLYIVLCNAGYLRLGEEGVHHADSFVCSDPGNGPETFKGFGDAKIEYHLSSILPPRIFDPLITKGRTVKVWNPHLEGGPAFSEDKVTIGTSGGAPVAAMILYAAMGHKKFRFYGMDGSSEYDLELLEGQATDEYLARLQDKDKNVTVRVGERIYQVPNEYWAQTEEMIQFLETYPKAINSVWFSGDTINAELFNDWTPGMDLGRKYEILSDNRPRNLPEFGI